LREKAKATPHHQMCQIDGDDDKGSDDQQSNLTITKSNLPDAKGVTVIKEEVTISSRI
jgi:hypothetical protein